MKNKIIFVTIILIACFSNWVVAYTPPEIKQDNTCDVNLNLCRAELQRLGDENELAHKDLEDLNKDRDYWKAQYESTKLDNFSVGEMEELKKNIVEINNYYNWTYGDILEINQTISFVKNFQLIISVAFILSFSLFSFALFKFKNKVEATFTSIRSSLTGYQVNIKNEKRSEPHKSSEEPHQKGH